MVFVTQMDLKMENYTMNKNIKLSFIQLIRLILTLFNLVL